MTHIPGTWQCDVCFEPVKEPAMVTLWSHGGIELQGRKYGWIAHYHSGCWSLIHAALYAAAKAEPEPDSPATLESIPVATVGQIFATRRSHRDEAGRLLPLGEPDLLAALRQVNAYRYALPRAGVTSLRQVAAMTDAQLLAIEGVGQKMLKVLREACQNERPKGT